MGDDRKVICDWKNCAAVAVDHVRYGFSADVSKTPVMALHGNYCRRHDRYIKEAFTNAHSFPLGQCPDGCEFEGMKIIQGSDH